MGVYCDARGQVLRPLKSLARVARTTHKIPSEGFRPNSIMLPLTVSKAYRRFARDGCVQKFGCRVSGRKEVKNDT